MDNKDRYECFTCKDTFEVNGTGCKDCCEHEFDVDEGYTCLNCGEQGEYPDYDYEDR